MNSRYLLPVFLFISFIGESIQIDGLPRPHMFSLALRLVSGYEDKVLEHISKIADRFNYLGGYQYAKEHYRNNFVIHGLWPSNRTSKELNTLSCYKVLLKNEPNKEAIEKELLKGLRVSEAEFVFPDVLMRYNNMAEAHGHLAIHQYKKHGMCTGIDENGDLSYDPMPYKLYFAISNHMLETMNLRLQLMLKEYYPSKTLSSIDTSINSPFIKLFFGYNCPIGRSCLCPNDDDARKYCVVPGERDYNFHSRIYAPAPLKKLQEFTLCFNIKRWNNYIIPKGINIRVDSNGDYIITSTNENKFYSCERIKIYPLKGSVKH